jgi:hypothetical protein
MISLSTNRRAVCRTSFSSSFSCESKSMKSTPANPAMHIPLSEQFLSAAFAHDGSKAVQAPAIIPEFAGDGFDR